MATILIDELDSRTSDETVKTYCQMFGRILHCYKTSNQCVVTFADEKQADDFLRSSPHRIDAFSFVKAKLKTMKTSNSTVNTGDQKRLIVRGNSEQITEKNLVEYFSSYGAVRMCLVVTNENYAVLTFDQSESCQRVFAQPRHFLQGRSLTVEPYSTTNKRRKLDEDQKSISNQEKRLEQQTNAFDLERQQWQIYLNQQLATYQTLIQQALDQNLVKDQEIQRLKNENQTVTQILQRSIVDYEQQRNQLRKCEENHQKLKRKYEDICKSYMKLKHDQAVIKIREKSAIGPS